MHEIVESVFCDRVVNCIEPKYKIFPVFEVCTIFDQKSEAFQNDFEFSFKFGPRIAVIWVDSPILRSYVTSFNA